MERKQNGQMGDKRFEGEGGGGRVAQWRYTGRRSPKRKLQCYK